MKMERFNLPDRQRCVDAYLDGGQATLAPHDLPHGTGARAVSKSSAGKVNALREVESAVEGALVRASRLRPAVLKSAFEGRL